MSVTARAGIVAFSHAKAGASAACDVSEKAAIAELAVTMSVVIVSYNTREQTLRCLADLFDDLEPKFAAGSRGQTSGRQLAAEVFVVDNGSRDDSVAAVRAAFPSVIVVETGRNAGFAVANNLALAQARGAFILLLNSDAFVRPGALASLVNYMTTHPKAAVVGPRLLNADGSLQKSCYKFPSPLRAFCEHTLLTAAFPNHALLGDYRDWTHDTAREVDFVIGACMLVRRAAIEQVGLFDEHFFMYSEDTDWCKRFRNAGWNVEFTPASTVVHHGGQSSLGIKDRQFCESSRSAERYMRKHHGWSGLLLNHVAMFIGSVIRIPLWSAIYFVSIKRRQAARTKLQTWNRILRWSLGIRGQGLSPTRG